MMATKKVAELIETTLREKCGVCEECIKIYTKRSDETSSQNPRCTLCLGILCDDSFQQRLLESINDKVNLYGGFHNNCISKDSPTVSIPSAIAIRIHCINCYLEKCIREYYHKMEMQQEEDKELLEQRFAIKKVSEIHTQIKDLIRSKIRQLVLQKYNPKKVQTYNNDHENNHDHDEVTQILINEEAGFLRHHVILIPPLFLKLPTSVLPLPKHERKRDRKRFRGNDPTAKQGGDPRTNLEKKVKRYLDSKLNENIKDVNEELASTIRENINCCMLEKNNIITYLDTVGSRCDVKEELGQWMHNLVTAMNESKEIEYSEHQTKTDISIHVSCWRNHFYLKGKYTKTRRDISQTPFYVNDDIESNHQSQTHDVTEQKRGIKRLGMSSVEEQICPIICKVGCNGISTENNDLVDSAGKNNLVYGMVKFHASGREDMDVRMILPPDTKEFADNCFTLQTKHVASGRPFVCDIVDAYKMPTKSILDKVVKEINHMSNDRFSVMEKASTLSDGKWVQEEERQYIRYGRNPKGVGISSLVYCPSSSFKNLQSDTEDKVKFYGCLCWSKLPIQSQDFLEKKLMRNGSEKNKSIYPLKLEQSTPLRVLHRRAAGLRIRHVLSLEAIRIDEHWFRLHLSTSAGTYVKEFVHGDCGRTKPSISSLLGSKTDIVELDCEGIAI